MYTSAHFPASIGRQKPGNNEQRAVLMADPWTRMDLIMEMIINAVLLTHAIFLLQEGYM